MPEIVLRKNEREVQRVKLGSEPVTIGRLANNHIVVDNAKVSRHHARIVQRDAHWIYEDLGSANGSFVNEERIRECQLNDGDEIRVTDHYLVFIGRDGGSLPVAAEPWSHVEEGVMEPSSSLEVLQSMFYDPGAAEQGAKRLQALFEISKILDEASDFQAVLAHIMDKAIAIMGAERGFLMLVDADSGELRVHVARDRKGAIFDLEAETISRSLMRKVIEKRNPILVLDAQSGEFGTKSVMAASIHAAICVPLISRDVVTGVIYVDHRSRGNAFTKHDLAFFTTFAVQAKSAIDSSRAYWDLVDSLFRASNDFVVVCSPSRDVTQANRAAAELLGRKPEDMVGMAMESMVTAAEAEVMKELCADTLGAGVVSAREITLQREDGWTVPLSVSSFAMRDRHGSASGICLIGRDLSEIKQLIGKLTQANEVIRATFGRYLSDEIVESLLESPDRLALGGEKRKVTILMSDLRGFTSVAERLPPEQVVGIINNYLGVMVDVITKYRGTIDEFIGDAILVIFGAPIQRPDDTVRAAACAVEMQLAMEQVNEVNTASGLPPVEMGIALNTGEVVVGNIGSQKRMKYAVVGTHVNLASRIETNTVGGQILIADSTLQDAGPVLEVGRTMELEVKGAKGLLKAHELRGVAGDYNVRLPDDHEPLVTLTPPLAVRYYELEGKRVTEDMLEGEVVRLGVKGLELRPRSHKTPLLVNVKMLMRTSTGEMLEDAYGKVIDEPVGDESCFYVRLTSVPPRVREFLTSLLG